MRKNIELFKLALSLANENGKEFLRKSICDTNIIKVIETNDNWFYIIFVYSTGRQHTASISQKDDCKSTYFGDVDYLKKHLKLKYNQQIAL